MTKLSTIRTKVSIIVAEEKLIWKREYIQENRVDVSNILFFYELFKITNLFLMIKSFSNITDFHSNLLFFCLTFIRLCQPLKNGCHAPKSNDSRNFIC